MTRSPRTSNALFRHLLSSKKAAVSRQQPLHRHILRKEVTCAYCGILFKESLYFICYYLCLLPLAQQIEGNCEEQDKAFDRFYNSRINTHD